MHVVVVAKALLLLLSLDPIAAILLSLRGVALSFLVWKRAAAGIDSLQVYSRDHFTVWPCQEDSSSLLSELLLLFLLPSCCFPRDDFLKQAQDCYFIPPAAARDWKDSILGE